MCPNRTQLIVIRILIKIRLLGVDAHLCQGLSCRWFFVPLSKPANLTREFNRILVFHGRDNNGLENIGPAVFTQEYVMVTVLGTPSSLTNLVRDPSPLVNKYTSVRTRIGCRAINSTVYTILLV